MISQPASTWTSACLHQDLDALVIGDITVDDHAVMAVIGIGIEGDIAQHADPGRCLLDGAHGAADEIVGIGGLAPVGRLQLGIGLREQGDDRNAEALRPRCAASAIRSTLSRSTPGMAATGSRRSCAVDHEERPDEIGRRQRGFRHQAAGPVLAPQAAHPQRGK